jgi:hypothetical protein
LRLGSLVIFFCFGIFFFISSNFFGSIWSSYFFSGMT